MGDIWQAARANNVKRVKALLDGGTSPDATRWVRSLFKRVPAYVLRYIYMFQPSKLGMNHPTCLPPSRAGWCAVIDASGG